MLQSEDCGISALWHIVMLWHIAVLHADGGVRMMQIFFGCFSCTFHRHPLLYFSWSSCNATYFTIFPQNTIPYFFTSPTPRAQNSVS